MSRPKDPVIDVSRVSSDLVADVLNMSRPVFIRHVRNGILPPSEENTSKYDLRRCVWAYLKYLEYGRGTSKIFDAKRSLLEEKFKQAKMENDEAEGRLVDIDAVENTWVQAMIAIATQLDALPGRLSSELAGVSDQAVIRQRLKHEIALVRRSAQGVLQAFLGHPPRDRSNRTTADSDTGRVGRREEDFTHGESGAGTLEELEDSIHDPDSEGVRKPVLSKNHRSNGKSNGKDGQSPKRDRAKARRRSRTDAVRGTDKVKRRKGDRAQADENDKGRTRPRA